MVSRETKNWDLGLFFQWYEKSVLTKHPEKTGSLSAEAAVITLLSKSINCGDLAVIISPNEKTANRLYSACYGLCPDFSFFLPGQGNRGTYPYAKRHTIVSSIEGPLAAPSLGRSKRLTYFIFLMSIFF